MISFSRRVSLCLWAYLMIAFPPFLILYLMGALTVGDDTIITLSKQTPTLTTMVVMSFVLPALGAVFSGKKTLILPWKLTLSELGKISALSVVLSFILWKFLHALSPWGVWGLFTLIIIFIFFLPQAGRFISSI